MSKIQIITDSASDISYADEQKYSISVIPFPITLGDKTYTSRVDFDNDQFFSLMAQCDEIPKTAQITPFQFQEIYLREAQEASDKWQYQLRRHWGFVSSYPGTGVQERLSFPQVQINISCTRKKTEQIVCAKKWFCINQTDDVFNGRIKI